MKKLLAAIISISFISISYSQTTTRFVENLRIKYRIPELAYAVVSADSILDMQVLGVQRVNTKYKARPNDRFRIGSNTKAITGFIAAELVKQG